MRPTISRSTLIGSAPCAAALGFAADNFLFYGTGGLAYGHMEVEVGFRLYDATTIETRPLE